MHWFSKPHFAAHFACQFRTPSWPTPCTRQVKLLYGPSVMRHERGDQILSSHNFGPHLDLYLISS
jgi:hypothetical protein